MRKKKSKQTEGISKNSQKPLTSKEVAKPSSSAMPPKTSEETIDFKSTPKPSSSINYNEDRVLNFLNKHGATGIHKIAKNLNLETSVVIRALGDLRDDGKIVLGRQ